MNDRIEELQSIQIINDEELQSMNAMNDIKGWTQAVANPINRSPEIDKLAQAMCEAQKSPLQATLNASNPYFGSRYADLGEVWRVAREVLPANGIAVFQIPSYEGGNVQVTTMLVHTSGQWLQGTVSLRPVKPDPQSFGSCITYARRYGLAAMVGIVADMDDDANAASDPRNPVPNIGEGVGVPAPKAPEPDNWELAETPPPAPSWEPDEEPAQERPIDWWRNVTVPFGPQKGTLISQLTKAKLFGWWANYTPKPYNGRITDADAQFREALNAAGKFYKLSKKD